MALIARMQDDFLNFSSDIQQVVVTPVNTSNRVSFGTGCFVNSMHGFYALRDMHMDVINVNCRPLLQSCADP
jgi:hypothetical protein